MNVNYVLLGFAVIISAIIAYTFGISGMDVIRCIFLGLFLVFCLGTVMAVSIVDRPRPTSLIKVVGSISLTMFIIMNIVFNVVNIGNEGFYIVNSLFIVLTLIVMYNLGRTKM